MCSKKYCKRQCFSGLGKCIAITYPPGKLQCNEFEHRGVQI